MAGVARGRFLQIHNVLRKSRKDFQAQRNHQVMLHLSLVGVRQMSTAPSYKYVLVDKKGKGGCVGLVTLNRPKALNAISDPLIEDLTNALNELGADPTVSAIVLTGSEKAFAAGADIRQMQTMTFVDVMTSNFNEGFVSASKIKKPLIAAVNGFALGGGCEVAMMCDIILAGEKARFGQPEIILGTLPGGGATQRLTHAIGKSRSMQMCLTGDHITAEQANAWGLVSSIHPPDQLVDEAIKLGEKIATHSRIAVAMCKESVNNAYEMSLHEGLHFEKKCFHASFATNDQKEGMSAFIEKRKPNFTDS